jgi:hypothetical protein
MVVGFWYYPWSCIRILRQLPIHFIIPIDEHSCIKHYFIRCRNTSRYYRIKAISKATVLSLSTILSVILAVGYALNFIMPSSFTLLEAMLLGAMIGGTSTIAVISVFDGLQKIIPA